MYPNQEETLHWGHLEKKIYVPGCELCFMRKETLKLTKPYESKTNN